MKKTLLSILFSAACISAAMAQTLTYRMEGNLREEQARGPALTPLGPGRFVQDTMDCSGQRRQTYRFDQNSGLQFNNRQANGWFRGSYTIEIFFKMDDLGSYRRVVDYKNRTSDQGAYLYSSYLNFYSIATSDTISFDEDRYGYYVITRDSATSRVRIYSSGRARLSFIDTDGDAVLDTAQKLNFFQDDLSVGNEASAGNVALITLFNRPLDSTQIFSRFTNVCSIVGLDDAATLTPARISPNPASGELNVALDAAWLGASYRVVSTGGSVLKQGSLGTVRNRLDIRSLPQGLYLLQVDNGKRVQSLRFTKE